MGMLWFAIRFDDCFFSARTVDQSPRQRARYVKENAYAARELLTVLPEKEAPKEDKFKTRKGLHEHFGPAFKHFYGEDIASRFRGRKPEEPPSEDEIRAIRRMIEQPLHAEAEGDRYDLTEAYFKELAGKELNLFPTPEEQDRLNELRKLMRVLPAKNLRFTLRVLKATLLKDPKLLGAIIVKDGGIELDPAKLTYLAYLAIP